MYDELLENIINEQRRKGSGFLQSLHPDPKVRNLSFTLWDVGQGLSIWIQTPAGHNHWIDLGKTESFSPSEYVNRINNESTIDYLVISHPHEDHLADLPNFIKSYGNPRVLRHNRTLPDIEKYGDGMLEYQKIFKTLDKAFTADVQKDRDPENPAYNGGVEYLIRANHYSEQLQGNNISLVTMILYNGLLLVCPGDIEDKGWNSLWQTAGFDFQGFINRANYRVLVAPHHGRKSGYSSHMMDMLQPHLTIISDIYGDSETHRGFREAPLGITFTNGQTIKYYSTKRGGRVFINATQSGEYTFNQYE